MYRSDAMLSCVWMWAMIDSSSSNVQQYPLYPFWSLFTQETRRCKPGCPMTTTGRGRDGRAKGNIARVGREKWITSYFVDLTLVALSLGALIEFEGG